MQPLSLVDILYWGIAIAGILATIYFFFKSRIFKRMEVRTIAETSVVDLDEPVPELQILYKGRQVDQLYVLEVEVINSGKRDFQSSDFIEPLTITTGAEIVDARVTERTPDSCDIKISRFEADKVFLDTKLFKVGERAKLKFRLLEEPRIDVTQNRIVDLRQIRTTPIRPVSTILAMSIAIVILSLAFNVFIYFRALTPRRELTVRFLQPSQIAEFFHEEIQGMYKGAPISELYRLTVLFMNTGLETIELGDQFGIFQIIADGKILDAKFLFPKRKLFLVPTYTLRNPNTLDISGAFISPEETMTLELLLQGTPNCRFEGFLMGGEIIIEQMSEPDGRMPNKHVEAMSYSFLSTLPHAPQLLHYLRFWILRLRSGQVLPTFG